MRMYSKKKKMVTKIRAKNWLFAFVTVLVSGYMSLFAQSTNSNPYCAPAHPYNTSSCEWKFVTMTSAELNTLNKTETTEEDKKKELVAQNTVDARGLAGKIKSGSGEYDPSNEKKEETTSGQINQNPKNPTQQTKYTHQQNVAESYVIFWVGDAAYGWGTTVKLNGQTFRPNKHGEEINRKVDSKATIILSKLGTAPKCSDETYWDDEISNSIIMYSICGIIKTEVVTGSTNNWVANVLVSPGEFQEVSGSFVAKPGCNIIEIK